MSTDSFTSYAVFIEISYVKKKLHFGDGVHLLWLSELRAGLSHTGDSAETHHGWRENGLELYERLLSSPRLPSLFNR